MGVEEAEEDAGVAGFGRVLACMHLGKALDSKDCARAVDLNSCCYCRSLMPHKAGGYHSPRTPSSW